jgi:hypothetical protein
VISSAVKKSPPWLQPKRVELLTISRAGRS